MAILILGVDYTPRVVIAVAEVIGQYNRLTKQNNIIYDTVACGPDNIPPSFWEEAKNNACLWRVIVVGNPDRLPEWIWKEMGKLELGELFVINSGLPESADRPTLTDFSCTGAGGITKFPVSLFTGNGLTMTETIRLWYNHAGSRKMKYLDGDFYVRRIGDFYDVFVPRWVKKVAGVIT